MSSRLARRVRHLPEGGRAQSAAIALHDAGAARVAVVVLGRHFDREFGSGETELGLGAAPRWT